MFKGYYISEYTVFIDVLFLSVAATVEYLSHIFFDVHVTVHRVKFLIMKPSRCTNFSNLFLEWNSTCFGQFLCPASGVFHCTHSDSICHTSLLTACLQAAANLYDIYHCCVYSEKLLQASCQQTCVTCTIAVCTVKNSCKQAVNKLVWHILSLCVQWKTLASKLSANLYNIYHCCVQWKTPDDGNRNCLKHVEFHFKNNFEKLVYLVGFIIRNLSQCTVKWTSK
jgi:hypothetical protein